MKLLTIAGTRPNLVKLDHRLKQVVVFTGQHYSKELIELGLKLPKIKYNLGEIKLGKMLDAIIQIIDKEKPTHVMVYGDTNSSLIGALAAKQCGVKLIHVEAGMRSGNMEMVEEQNRIIIDHVSDFLLCPSKRAADNLELEKVKGQIGVCGATQVDTCFEQFPTRPIKKYGKFMLLTLHRAENVDDPIRLQRIFNGLECDMKIVFPVHPRTKKRIKEFKIDVPKNVLMIPPLKYKDFIFHLGNAWKLLTDSGGAQVEAHFMRIPCITLRNETEWVETVEDGWNRIAGTFETGIKRAIQEDFNIAKGRDFHYGKGYAKDAIKNFIESL